MKPLKQPGAAEASVARRLRSIRQERRLTGGAVGQRLDPPRTYAAVSDVECGRTRLTLDLIDQFCRIYGVSRDWVLDEWLWERNDDEEAVD